MLNRSKTDWPGEPMCQFPNSKFTINDRPHTADQSTAPRGRATEQ